MMANDLVMSSAPVSGEALVPAMDPLGQQDPSTPDCTHYDFKVVGEREGSCFRQRETREKLRQWGMEDSLTLTQASFCPAFMPHGEKTFVRQLLAFTAESEPRTGAKVGVRDVQLQALRCTAMSMDFFDCLIEKGIVSKSGNIHGCFPDVFEGVTVSDKLRELLTNPDSENAEAFSADQQEELLFHLFRALSVGGGVCQPDDSLDPYKMVVKALYKELVSVQKNSSTGKLEIAACKAYLVAETSDRDDEARRGGGTPTTWNRTHVSEPSPHNVCIVVVNLAKKRASVLRKEYLPFW